MNAVTGRRRLSVPEVEKALMKVALDLKEILVLDGVDAEDSGSPSIRIRCHDLCGPLPDILVEDTGDRYSVLDNIIREGAKRIVMVRVRKELAELHPGCEFLLPTSTDKDKVAGFRAAGKTVLAEAPSFWEAYYELWRKVAGVGS